MIHSKGLTHAEYSSCGGLGGFPNRRRAELLRIKSECDWPVYSEELFIRHCKEHICLAPPDALAFFVLR